MAEEDVTCSVAVEDTIFEDGFSWLLNWLAEMVDAELGSTRFDEEMLEDD